MKHARKDYAPIQAPISLIPADEPVFLLRAQDETAPDVVDFWADEVQVRGGDKRIVDAARHQADEMRKWQQEHGFKIPDMPEDA